MENHNFTEKINLRFPLESREIVDADTGRRVRQVTNAPAIHHHPFFLAPAYDAQQRWLCFCSHRTGTPQIFLEDFQQGCLRQITQTQALDEWSLYPWGDWIYYLAHGCVLRVQGQSGQSETLLSQEELCRIVGEKAAPAGALTVSPSGRYVAFAAKAAGQVAYLLYDQKTHTWAKVYTGTVISHAQFCPVDEHLVFFAGPLTDRPWVLHWPSGQAKLVFQRDAAHGQWITHESWIGGSQVLSLVDWPHGILALDIQTGQTSRLTDMNAWHAISNVQGTQMVFDTNFPDRGLWMLDLTRVDAGPQLLCCPHASCMGEHWNGPFPYDHGPIAVYAPQHTHPHPRFSPDGRKVVYTSDASGFSQVYELTL